jgi:tRNA uridine 5-carbamoylmethylation protein Kti12
MNLYIMRGLPGSGKSTMARHILAQSLSEGAEGYIFSTDDYFLSLDGKYIFDPIKLAAAHAWNQDRAVKAMTKHVDTIIIDNTNILKDHYALYVTEAKARGYRINIVTVGSFDPDFIEQCFLRNTHGVPLHTIQRMAKNFEL